MCSKLDLCEKATKNAKAELEQNQYNLSKSVSECEELRGFQKAYNQLKSMYEDSQSSQTGLNLLENLKILYFFGGKAVSYIAALENAISEQKQELQKKSLELTQFQQIIQ